VNAEKLNSFGRNFYTDKNIVVSAASSHSVNALNDLVGKSFSGLSTQTTERAAELSKRPDFCGSEMNIRDDERDACQFAVGYETFGYFGKEAENYKYPLLILKALLGKWQINDYAGENSSHSIVEEFTAAKLVDQGYNTFNFSYKNTGVFGVYCSSTNTDEINDAVYEVFNEYQRLYSRIGTHDLVRAKHQVIAEYLNSIATSGGRANVFGSQLAKGLVPFQSPEDIVNEINKVSVQQVYDLISTFFQDTDPVIIAHGPTEWFPNYVWSRYWTYWARW